jgi:Na+/H+ antiporter NhaD/arsenite permease-like protein
MDFFRFLEILFVPSAAGLVVSFLVVTLVFRGEFSSVRFMVPEEGRRVIYRPLLVKSLAAVVMLLAGIAFRLPLALAALLPAAFLLITRRLKPERVFSEIDWSLLVLFSGLFVLTDTLRGDPGFRRILDGLVDLGEKNLVSFGAVSAVLRTSCRTFPPSCSSSTASRGFPGQSRHGPRSRWPPPSRVTSPCSDP